MTIEHISVDYNNLSENDRQGLLLRLYRLLADIKEAIELVEAEGDANEKENLHLKLVQIMKPLNECVAVIEGREPEKLHHKLESLITLCVEQESYFRLIVLKMRSRRMTRFRGQD